MVANFSEMEGGTALHAAAARTDLRLAKALLEAGVDPTVRDAAGRTALGVIRERHGADGMATALFERALGPDPSSRGHSTSAARNAPPRSPAAAAAAARAGRCCSW